MRLFKLKARFWRIHQGMFTTLVFFVVVIILATSTAQTCDGELTFEKVGGHWLDLQTSPSTSVLISHPGEVILRDCMTLCLNSSSCHALNIDYTGGLCTSLQDVEGKRNLLKFNRGASFFEKVCISGVRNLQTICNDRLWAFESIRGATFNDFEDTPQIHRPVNRTECQRLCLMEAQFACRSAQYDTLTSTCRLSHETRWSQPAAFRTQQGINMEYLENQCSETTMSCHYDDPHQDETIAAHEYKTGANDEAACQHLCDESSFFICRSYTYNAGLNACFLSAEDSSSRDLAFSAGYNYVERKCTSQCTEGIITYEKITGYQLRNARSHPLVPALIGSTANCLNQCKSDQTSPCRSVHLDYSTGDCYRLDRDSQGDRANELVPQIGLSYFEQVCLRGRTQSCINKAWAFERVQNHEIQGHDDRIISNVQSRIHCEEACIQETQFECRSAEYDRWNIECRLSRHDRRTRPEDFAQTQQPNDVEYLEYQCGSGHYLFKPYAGYDTEMCNFTEMVQGLPRYVDSAIADVESLEECQELCNAEVTFQCRSMTYQMSNQECLLSGDDSISGRQRAFVLAPGATYYERQCQIEIENATIPIQTESPEDSTSEPTTFDSDVVTLPFPFTPPTQEPFPTFPTPAPFPSGRCTGGLGKTEYERTTGYKITVELTLLHDGGGNLGISQECIIKCNVDPSCQGFVLDYQSNRCYMLENDPSTNRNLLQRGQSVAYFEPVCYQVSTGCGKLWTFERFLQKQLRVNAMDIIKGISKTDCEQRCLSATQFLCRSANYDTERQECHLTAENRQTQSTSTLMDSTAFDYLENECYAHTGGGTTFTRADSGTNNNPLIKQTVRPPAEIDVHPRKSSGSCYYSNEAVSSRLSYVERTVNVAFQLDCQRACDIETTFNCRSISFSVTGFSTAQCYLSADTRNSLGAELRTVASSTYAERICSESVVPPFPKPITSVPYPRPYPPEKPFYYPAVPPPGPPGSDPYQPHLQIPYLNPYPQYPGQYPNYANPYIQGPYLGSLSLISNSASLRDGQQFPLPGPTAYIGPRKCLELDTTFERITKLANQGFGSEVRISLEYQPSLDCIRECLAFGDQCQSITFKSSFQGYSTPCTVYNAPSGGALTPPTVETSAAYFQKICLPGGKCDKAWAFDRVPFYYLEGYDDLELLNVNTKEECETACLQQNVFPCRSAEYFYAKAVCRLSRETRRSQPYAFQYFGDGVEYFENQCNSEPGFCGFVEFSNKFLPYFDRRIFGLADLYSCQMACVREEIFYCRSANFDDKTKECYLASCDRFCGYENIDRYYTTYSERVTCGHDLRPVPLSASTAFRHQLSEKGMQPVPNSNALALQRYSEPEGCGKANAKITFERTTGYAPTAVHHQLLPTSRVRGVTQECIQQCLKLANNCQAFVLIYLPPPSMPECLIYAQSAALQASLPETEQLQNKPDVVFFEKICFVGSMNCNKLWTFDRMFGYEFINGYFMTYETTATRKQCEEYCLRFVSYPCRSASYSVQTKTCRLNTESRHTNPSDFRYAGSDMQYLENQCVLP